MSDSLQLHGFPSREYWSGLPCLPPGDLPDPRIEPISLHWQADSLLLSKLSGKPIPIQSVKEFEISRRDDLLLLTLINLWLIRL